MTIKFKPTALIAGIVLTGAVQSARADVTVTTHMTMHNPMMDKMMAGQSKQQADAINSMMNTTTYISGKRYRVENPMMTMIMDGNSKQMIMVSPAQHTYSIMALTPQMLKGMTGGPGAGMQGKVKPTYKITDTGQTTQILGHTCRHYIMDMKMTMGATGTMTMHSDIMAAQDIPGLDPTAMSAFTSQMGMQGPQVKGVPLLTTTKMTSGMTGGMTMTQKATSVSTAPIPASKFEIPKGYKKTAQPNFMGGMGGGMMGH